MMFPTWKELYEIVDRKEKDNDIPQSRDDREETGEKKEGNSEVKESVLSAGVRQQDPGNHKSI